MSPMMLKWKKYAEFTARRWSKKESRSKRSEFCRNRCKVQCVLLSGVRQRLPG